MAKRQGSSWDQENRTGIISKSVRQKRKKKRFHMDTYKMHSLGDFGFECMVLLTIIIHNWSVKFYVMIKTILSYSIGFRASACQKILHTGTQGKIHTRHCKAATARKAFAPDQ